MFKQNISLRPYTTFGIGGIAKKFVEVQTAEELLSVVEEAQRSKTPYELIAGGSNVVFSDKVISSLIIRFTPPWPSPRGRVGRGRGLILRCPANLPLENLITEAISNGLAGIETLSGIPGTVGGAIVGNAGAYGQSISDCLTRVQIFDSRPLDAVRPKGRTASGIRWLSKKQCQFSYRNSIFKDSKKKNWLILRAEFKLKKGDKKELEKKSREIIKIRLQKYNPSLRCPGSFFKNVLVKEISKKSLKLIDLNKIRDSKLPAGYLLESVGAKGMRIGGIYVADFHGNLLVNDGHGTYRDVITLATKLKKLVKNKFGITLEEEVRYIV